MRGWEDNIKMKGSAVLRCRLASYFSGQGRVSNSYEHGNEIWDSRKGREFLDAGKLLACQREVCLTNFFQLFLM
jgi:hypothetical protein